MTPTRSPKWREQLYARKCYAEGWKRQGTRIRKWAKRYHRAPKPVIAGRYRDLHLAAVMNSLLDSAGIAEFLAYGTMIRLDGLISNALRGSKAWTRGQRLPAAAIPETFEVEGIGPCRNARIAARLTFF